MTNRRAFLSGALALGAMAGRSPLWAGVDCAKAPQRVEKLAGPCVLSIAHCGDPQLGFAPECKTRGEEFNRINAARFACEMEAVKKLAPDVVFVAGDMCHITAQMEGKWTKLRACLPEGAFVAPGNHDIPNFQSKAAREAWLRVFGCDRRSAVVKGFKLILHNSQYWRNPDAWGWGDEAKAWFAREFADAKAKGLPVIAMSHIPPFDRNPGEKDGYNNYPLKGRKAYLDKMVDGGLKFYLAGHTHRMQFRTYRGIPLLNSETTCWNFDKRPFGFRLLRIDAQLNYEWNFVPVP